MISPINSSPISTKIIQFVGEATEKNVVESQKNPSIVATPEKVNEFTDNAQDGVQNVRQREQTEQEAVRSLAVNMSHHQHQQELVEQYISQSTGNVENKSTVNANDVVVLAQQNKKLNTIEHLTSAKNKFSDAVTPSRPPFFHIQV